MVSYRIVDGTTDVDVTAHVTDDTLTWVAPGGCESAELTVDQPRSAFPTLGSRSRLVVTDDNGRGVWEGYVSDPGDFDDDDGTGLRIAAVGSMVRGSDVVMPLVYLDADLGSWEAAAGADVSASARADIAPGDDGAADVMQFGFQAGFAIGPGATSGFDYRRLIQSPQGVGGLVVTYSCGTATGYVVDVVAIDASNNHTQVASWPATASAVTRTVTGLPVGTRCLRLRLRRTGAATNVVGELAVCRVTSAVLIGARVDRFGQSATDAATDLTSADVVEDLIGRGVLAEVEPAAAVIEDSPAVYRQLAFPEGARGTTVLQALREQDPAMTWAYGSRAPGLGGAGTGGFEFAWRRWPTTVHRYDLDAADAIDRPGGEDESCQRVTVHYTDLGGVRRFETVTVDVLPGERVRDADPISIDDPIDAATALARGTEALAGLANRSAAGTAVVTATKLDRDTATRVEPHELRPGCLAKIVATGELVQVTGVEWSGAGGSVATLAIGEVGATIDDRVNAVVRGEVDPRAPLVPLPAPRPTPPLPTGLPSTDPTVPPSEALTVKVTGDATGLTAVASGDAVERTTLLRWTINGTVVETTRSQVVRFTTDAAGQPLMVDVDYQVTVQPTNVAGDGAQSAAAVGRLDPGMTAETVLGIVTAGFVLAGAVDVGGITISPPTADDPGGIRIPLTDGGEIRFPADGSDAVITAMLRARSLVVEGNLRVLGQTNLIEGGIALASGVTAPSTAPRVTLDWANPASNDLEYFNGVSSVICGFVKHDGFWWLATRTSANNTVLWRATPGGTSGYTPLEFTPTEPAFWPVSLCRIADRWYVFGYDPDRSLGRYIYVYDDARAKVAEIFVGSATLVWSQGSLATDGTDLLLAYFNNTAGEVIVNRYSTAGALLRRDRLGVDWQSVAGSKDVRGLYLGTADFGATRFAVAGNTSVRVFTTGGASGTAQTRVAANDWLAPTNQQISGLSWDGTRFHALTASGRVYHYARRPVPETRSYSHAYFDSDPAGLGLAETQPGESISYTAPARTWIRVEMDPPADGGGPDDPDSLRVYVANHRQPDLAPGVTAAVYDTLDLTGPSGQTVNGFASRPGSIGDIRSTAADSSGPLTYIDGSGTWRMDPAQERGRASRTVRSSATTSAPNDTPVLIPGLILTVPVASTTDELEVTAFVDARATATGGDVFVGTLHVDGSATPMPGQVLFATPTAGLRGTPGQQWRITGLAPGDHSFEIRAAKTAAGGTITVGGDHSSLSAKRV